MRIKFLLFGLLVVLAGLWLIGCKHPDNPEPNLPPMLFSVKATLSPTSTDVVLIWNPAKDPNGDPVTYSVVYKDTLVRNLTDTTYTFQRGSYVMTITGKVIASDSHGALTSVPFSVSVGNNPSLPETIRFVKPDDGRTVKNGISWATAYDQNQLQTAINSLSVTGGQVWVAQGLYKPTTDITDRNASFSLRSRVAIYGGFSPDTTLVDTRNPGRFPTILSGDIDGDGTLANNSYSVVKNKGGIVGVNITSVDSTAMVDGFTITGGNGQGGIHNETASPAFVNCIITGNIGASGGGIHNYYFCRPYFINCLISANSAVYGGGLYNYGSAPRLINCVILNNTAQTSGGGFYNTTAAAPIILNCTLTGNSAPRGGALSSITFSGNTFYNCILWNNGGVHAIHNYTEIGNQFTYDIGALYCLIEEEARGFVDYRNGNNQRITVSPFSSDITLALRPGSAAINGGSNELYHLLIGPATDFAGNSRIINQIIDVGAIEYK